MTYVLWWQTNVTRSTVEPVFQPQCSHAAVTERRESASFSVSRYVSGQYAESVVYFCHVCPSEAHSFCGHSSDGAASLTVWTPSGPPRANTHRSPSPPTLVCFALISVRMGLNDCVSHSLFVCVCVVCNVALSLWWLPADKDAAGGNPSTRLLRQYWLSHSTSFTPCLLICVTIEPKYTRSRCTGQVVQCAVRFLCCDNERVTLTKHEFVGKRKKSLRKRVLSEIDWEC